MDTVIAKNQGGVPPGGATDEVLKKNSSSDFDYDWGPVPGGTSAYAVNADESIFSYFTSQVTPPGSAGWSNNPAGGGTLFGNFSTQSGGGGSYQGSIAYLMGGAGDQLLFTTPKIVRLKYLAKINAGVPNATAIYGGGLAHSANIANGHTFMSTSEGVYFLWDTGTLYAIACDNSAFSTVVISGIVETDIHLYEIVYDQAGATADFYVDGVLQATISGGHLPTGRGDTVGISFVTTSSTGLTATSWNVSHTVVSIEL